MSWIKSMWAGAMRLKQGGTVQQALGYVTPEMFGRGTAAFSDMAAATVDQTEIRIQGADYPVNHRESADGLRVLKVLADNVDIKGAGRILAAPGIYDDGMAAGQTRHMPAVQTYGDYSRITGLFFDGNLQGANNRYMPGATNVLLEGAKCLGRPDGSRVNGWTVSLSYCIDGSGTAFACQNTDTAIIALSYGQHHQGMGFGGNNDRGVLIGNISYSAYDAPYIANTANYIAMVGNVGVDSNNGAAADIVGTKYGAMVANVLSGHAKRGVQIRRSPNTGTDADGLIIAGNLTHNNTKADKAGNAEQAEITLGLRGSSESGRHVAVLSNHSIIKDESATGTKRAFYAADGMDRAVYSGNVISAEGMPTDRVVAVVDGVSNLAMAGNIATTNTKALVRVDGFQGRFRFRDNVNIGIDPASTAWPSEMVNEDGYWRYNVRKFLATTDAPIVTINWPGGFQIKEIELTIIQNGERGAVKRRVVARGAAALPTVIMSDAGEGDYSVGVAPPVITVDSSEVGVLKLLGRVQGGAETDICAIYARVIGDENSNVIMFGGV